MNRKSTITLVKALGNHPPLTTGVLDELYLFRVLDSTKVPASRRFYQEIGDNTTQISDPATDLKYYLLLRRILRNDVATQYIRQGYKLPALKKEWKRIADVLGVYDSDVVTRQLRTDPEMLEAMAKAHQDGHLYSLLAALETRDNLSNKIAKRPIIVVVGADLTKLVEWEVAHTKHYIQKDTQLQEISKEQYFGH